jgi:hypothetical protein
MRAAKLSLLRTGMALGGACEFIMHCDRTVAALESYIGLVEGGVGLLPAGAGSKELAVRAAQEVARGANGGQLDQLPLRAAVKQALGAGIVGDGFAKIENGNLAGNAGAGFDRMGFGRVGHGVVLLVGMVIGSVTMIAALWAPFVGSGCETGGRMVPASAFGRAG